MINNGHRLLYQSLYDGLLGFCDFVCVSFALFVRSDQEFRNTDGLEVLPHSWPFLPDSSGEGFTTGDIGTLTA